MVLENEVICFLAFQFNHSGSLRQIDVCIVYLTQVNIKEIVQLESIIILLRIFAHTGCIALYCGCQCKVANFFCFKRRGQVFFLSI
jgi:hypothetical protein